MTEMFVVGPFAMLIAYLTQIRWEEIKMRMQEAHLRNIVQPFR